jgi:pseudaminic acid cytidylyltransferase
MRRVAIIPARGGSKRIPRKNIRMFDGKPMIAYAIETALESGIFEEVMVSTDDEEIAAISSRYGAKIPFFRSGDNSNDTATTVSVLLEVLHTYSDKNMFFDFGCCIYPSNPFLTAKKLSQSLNMLEEEGFDTVISAVRYSSPVQRSFVLENGKMKMLFPENLNTRSQDLPPVFHDAAQFYWFRCDRLLEQQKLWTENTGILEIPETEVQDIDTLTDWDLAEVKFRLWKR